MSYSNIYCINKHVPCFVLKSLLFIHPSKVRYMCLLFFNFLFYLENHSLYVYGHNETVSIVSITRYKSSYIDIIVLRVII